MPAQRNGVFGVANCDADRTYWRNDAACGRGRSRRCRVIITCAAIIIIIMIKGGDEEIAFRRREVAHGDQREGRFSTLKPPGAGLRPGEYGEGKLAERRLVEGAQLARMHMIAFGPQEVDGLNANLQMF